MIVVLCVNRILFQITWRLKINDLSLSAITDQLNPKLQAMCPITGVFKKLLR